jgi:hypothetical protein
MASTLQIANEALAEIAAGSIAAFDEDSRESSEINRFFAPLLEEVLDWCEWPWARRYVTLASITNDRPAEWLYAYAKPTDCAQAIAVRDVQTDASVLPLNGPFTLPWQDASPIRFILEGEKIYTNAETATLVYSTTTIEANKLPPLVRRAFALELAARIAYPVKKDMKLADMLLRKAEVARQRAIADEENKNPRLSTRYVSDAEYARLGYE